MALALLAALVVASYRASYPLPAETIPDGWGVNIHFTQEQPGEGAKIAAAGFHWIRMDFAWAGIERRKAEYDFSAYDRLMSSLDRNHLRALFILDYGNDLYQTGSPRSPEARDGFCGFVAAAMAHFRHRGIVWEMWNEPNGSFWQPKASAEEYIALAEAVGKTIRRIAPDEWFIGPATSGFDWNFLRACFDAGMLQYWDAVSVHPYRRAPPETAVADWDSLRSMISGAAPPGRIIAMFSGEWGYSTAWNGIDDETQANYAVRQYLMNLASGVPLSIWYDWKDDGSDPKNGEHRFGITRQDTTPKPGYLAIQALTRQLAGFHFVSRMVEHDPSVWRLRFEKENKTLFVGWTSNSAMGRLTTSPQVFESAKAAIGAEIEPPVPSASADGRCSPGICDAYSKHAMASRSDSSVRTRM